MVVESAESPERPTGIKTDVLRVIVQLIPAGDEARISELGRLVIANITRDPSWSNEYGDLADYVIRGHRRRSDSFWTLVCKAIEGIEPTPLSVPTTQSEPRHNE